jgi:hypothetical protein
MSFRVSISGSLLLSSSVLFLDKVEFTVPLFCPDSIKGFDINMCHNMSAIGWVLPYCKECVCNFTSVF